eukprot:EG_transcript_8819
MPQRSPPLASDLELLSAAPSYAHPLVYFECAAEAGAGDAEAPTPLPSPPPLPAADYDGSDSPKGGLPPPKRHHNWALYACCLATLLFLLLTVSCLLRTVTLLNRLVGTPARRMPVFAKGRFGCRAIAHMGGDKLRPGNTLPAYAHAMALGADVLDMDLHLTRDGALALMHDESAGRTTDLGDRRQVDDMTLADIKRLDAAYHWSPPDAPDTYPYRGTGIRIPTLPEVFRAFPHARYTVEMKRTRHPIAAALCHAIHRYNMTDRIIVSSFHHSQIMEFRHLCPGVATSASSFEIVLFYALSTVRLSWLLSPRYESLQVPYDLKETKGFSVVTERFVAAAHASNVQVEVWTVDDPDLMARALRMGVDAIFSDRPDLLLRVLKAARPMP